MSEWAKYGFPNPGLMAIQRPLEGLHKALHERKLEPIANILATEYVPVMVASGAFYTSFDAALKAVVPQYVNQFDTDGAFWTWETITAKATENKEPLREYPEPQLEPEYSLLWAIQRYRIINLLKIKKNFIPASWIFEGGSEHTGIPSSIGEALDTVLNRMNIVKNFWTFSFYTSNVRLQVSMHGIYGPDHGWREGSYCINVYSASKAFIDTDFELPKGIEYKDCHLSFTAVNANPDGPFDDCGTGVAEGPNTYTADDNGVFFQWDPNLTSPATPTPGHETYKGFRAQNIEIYYVAQPDFIFQDEI